MMLHDRGDLIVATAAVLHPMRATRYRQQVEDLYAAIKAGGEKAGREVAELVRGIEIMPRPWPSPSRSLRLLRV